MALAVALTTLAVAAGASPATADEEPPTFGWVGDSVPFQSWMIIPEVVGADRRIVLHESGLGLEIRNVMRATRASVLGSDPPDIFVAFIGTAQSHGDPPDLWRRELTRLLDLVSPRVECIRVFEIDDTVTGFYAHHDRTARAYNRITRQVTERYANAEWYHYDAWAALAGPEYERPDILHHNKQGAIAIARLMRHAANSCDPAMTTGPFWDVPDAHPAAPAVRWIGEQGLFDGYANGTYRLKIGSFVQYTTRGAFLEMAWRLAGAPGGLGPHPWSPTPAALEAALRWNRAEGLLAGYPDGTWRARVRLTRGQAVKALWRLAGQPGSHPDAGWTDTDHEAVRWATHLRLLSGHPDDTFRPAAPLTRAQLANLLFRYAALPPAPPRPSDSPPSSAAPSTTAPVTTIAPVTTAPPTTVPVTTTPGTTVAPPD